MGIYLKDGKFYESPVHTVHSLEAVGAGDAFAGGLLHCLARGFAPQKTIDFSITASVMKLMIQHDFNVVNEGDILKGNENSRYEPAKIDFILHDKEGKLFVYD